MVPLNTRSPRPILRVVTSWRVGLLVCLSVLSAILSGPAYAGLAATVTVATLDSSERARSSADFVGDGVGDQDEINAAIRSLPTPGGKVVLMEGTYDIRRVEGSLGGVIIDRSNVTFAGQGTSTRLIQAPKQETNVIRIIGSGVGHVTIRDMYVDANRDENPIGHGDPNVSHARFEFCGIKAYYRKPGGPGGIPNHDITIMNTHVVEARRLGIMLEGHQMKVINNVLGNAMSDAVEILTGPGEIRGNYFEITGRTHVAVGSDRGNSIIMANNIVHVKKGGDLDIGFRSWAGSQRHVIANNVLTVDPGGKCAMAMDVRGNGAAITGNTIHSSNTEDRLRLLISAGGTVLAGNVLENVVVEVDDRSGGNKPIIVDHNFMGNSSMTLRQGKLVTSDASLLGPAGNTKEGE